MDVTGGKDIEGQNVQVYTRHKGANQHWKIVYVDTAEDQSKGLNKYFGFRINKPFYIVSRLPMNRIVYNTGGNTLRLMSRPQGKNAQERRRSLFVFDGKSKTIQGLDREG